MRKYWKLAMIHYVELVSYGNILDATIRIVRIRNSNLSEKEKGVKILTKRGERN